MATAAQIEANRRNARQSTGPRTQRGKDRARLNALVHGLRASLAEATDAGDAELRRQLREQLDAEWRPGSAVEHMVVDQIADTYLRLRRCPAVEANILAKDGRTVLHAMAGDFSTRWPSNLLKLHQYESRLAGSLRRLIQQLRDLQRERLARDAEAEAEAGAEVEVGEEAGAEQIDAPPTTTTDATITTANATEPAASIAIDKSAANAPATPAPGCGETEFCQTNPIPTQDSIESAVTEGGPMGNTDVTDRLGSAQMKTIDIGRPESVA